MEAAASEVVSVGNEALASGVANVIGSTPVEKELPEKRCSSCFSVIDTRSTVCRNCRSFQGVHWWTRLIGLSTQWFALIITAGGLFYNSFGTRRHTIYEDVNFFVQSTKAGRFEVSVYNASGDVIFIPSVIHVGCSYLKSNRGASGLDLQTVTGTSTRIAPKDTGSMSLVIGELDNQAVLDTYLPRLQAFAKAHPGTNPLDPTCQLNLEIYSSQPSVMKAIEFDPYLLRQLFMK